MDDSIKYDDIKTIPNNYKPIIYNMGSLDNKFKITNASPTISTDAEYPLPTFGFQQFIHATEEKLYVLKDFEGKKPLYRVMYPFDKTIDEYDADIFTVSKEYFNLSNDDKLEDIFYELWEINMLLQLVNIDSKPYVSAHFSDNDLSSARSIMMFRELFSKNAQKDIHYIINKTIEENKISDKIQLISKSSELKTIKKVDIVTSNITTHTKVPTKEQESLKIILNDILAMLKILNNDGAMICKCFETYTMSMNKLIYVLSQLFNETYFVKPVSSDSMYADKFFVGIGFKNNKNIISQLDKILVDNKSNVVDIFPDLELPKTFIKNMMALNTEIANKQIIAINDVVSYIKSQNYYGDSYKTARLEQINAATYWINTYYPTKKDYSKTNEILTNLKKDVFDFESNREKNIITN